MGAFFSVGETKVRPGMYMRYTNAGIGPEGAIIAGICAAAFKADWGPLGVSIDIETSGDLDKYYGTDNGTTNNCGIVTEQLKNSKTVKAVRLGTGGTNGALTLKDTAGSPANVINVTAKYPGTRALTVTIRDSLTDTAKREFIIYEGTKELQKIEFTKGTAEIDALIAAWTASGSDWVTLSKVASGNGIMATVSQSALAGGANPTITNSDYSAALLVLEPLSWNVLSVDSVDAAVLAIVQAFIQRIFRDGKLVATVIGEPSSVAFATRKTNAAAYNDFCIMYVGNGYKDAAGVTYEGAKACAYVAGLVASGPANKSFTHQIISGAVALSETLTNPQITQALQSGMIVFTTNALGQVQIEYGINTLVSLSADQDAGWKKIRRVNTRFELMTRIAMVTDPLIGKVDNDNNGRGTIIAAAQGIINKMAKEGKLLPGGLIFEDPDNPAQGDSAWFKIAVDDLDSGEKLYFTFGFRFAAE